MQNKKDPRQVKLPIKDIKDEKEFYVEDIKEDVLKNDAGEEISVENGYSPADIEELKQLQKEDDGALGL